MRTWARMLACIALGLALPIFAASTTPPVAGAPSWAHWQTVDFEHVGVSRGLPHATVNAFTQDRDGLMWIGTVGGLARYDGQRTQVFRQSEQPGRGPPDDYIRALRSTPDGSILVGTTSGGLARFDPHTNRFTSYDRSPGRGTGSRIYALTPDPAGGFWIAGQDGLSHLGADLRQVRRPPTPGLAPGVAVFAILHDAQHRLWAGSSRGLYVRQSGAKVFQRVTSDEADAADVLGEDVWSLLQDRAGNVWAGGGTNGVVKIDAHGDARVPPALRGDGEAIQHRTIRDLLELPDGRLWIATDGVGVVGWDPRTGVATPIRHDSARTASLGGNIVRALFLDRSAGVWVATESAASRHDIHRSTVHVLDGQVLLGSAGALAGQNVRSVYTDRAGTVWLGFSRGRVAALDPVRGTIRVVVLDGTQSDQDVRAIDELADGRILVGSRGLVSIDPVTLRVRPFALAALDHQPILALSAHSGGLWIGTYDGLYQVADNGRTSSYRHVPGDRHSLVDNHVRNIVPLDGGEIWIGTANGIAVFDPRTRQFDNLQNVPGDRSSLPQNYVGSIVAANGRIWVGTYGGLASTTTTADDPAHPFVAVRREDEMASDDVASVLADRFGRLWTASTSGLSVYDPRRQRTQTLGVRDGLRTHLFNQRTAAIGPAGELLFGGLGGLTVVEPSTDGAPARTQAALAVTAMTVNEREVPFARLPRPGHALDTGADTRSIRVGFALLDYTAPEEVRYAYRLEGFDEPWVAIDPGARPETKYTNLPGGSYQLLLRARIPGLHPQTVDARIPLLIGPRWHERSSVRLALLAVLLGAMYALVHVRTVYLRRRTAQLAQQVREQTSELRTANRALQHVANTDGLTGLLTRRALMEQLEREYVVALCQQRPLSILMLDLDTFKRVNDRFGHLAGDAVLCEVARIIVACSRRGDHVGRYGGEEFLLILHGTSAADAAAIAEAICQAIASCTLPFEGDLLQFTASIGVATQHPGEPPQSLIARADAALYRAKRAGRNRVQAAPH
ncbi:MAG: diguanylate cyclase [Rhodanobacter sp.]